MNRLDGDERSFLRRNDPKGEEATTRKGNISRSLIPSHTHVILLNISRTNNNKQQQDSIIRKPTCPAIGISKQMNQERDSESACSGDDDTATDESSYGHMGDGDEIDDEDEEEEEEVEDEGDSIGSYH